MFSASSAVTTLDPSTVAGFRSDDVPAATRAKIAAHPLYPKLLEAFIDCQKV